VLVDKIKLMIKNLMANLSKWSGTWW
jgi:hypothetical protein